MQMRSEDVRRTVDRIDADRREHLFRMTDRPSTEFVPVRQRQHPDIVKAKAQARTAAWRMQGDRLGRPEARDIGMALVTALVTSDLSRLTVESGETTFITSALADLAARGFDRKQTLLVLRRLRNRLVDPGDRQGEESETTGAAIVPTSWESSTKTIF
jgi:hypothetical protein